MNAPRQLPEEADVVVVGAGHNGLAATAAPRAAACS